MKYCDGVLLTVHVPEVVSIHESGKETSRYAEVVAIFQTDFFVCGLSIWDSGSIAVLGYNPSDADEENEVHAGNTKSYNVLV